VIHHFPLRSTYNIASVKYIQWKSHSNSLTSYLLEQRYLWGPIPEFVTTACIPFGNAVYIQKLASPHIHEQRNTVQHGCFPPLCLVLYIMVISWVWSQSCSLCQPSRSQNPIHQVQLRIMRHKLAIVVVPASGQRNLFVSSSCWRIMGPWHRTKIRNPTIMWHFKFHKCHSTALEGMCYNIPKKPPGHRSSRLPNIFAVAFFCSTPGWRRSFHEQHLCWLVFLGDLLCNVVDQLKVALAFL